MKVKLRNISEVFPLSNVYNHLLQQQEQDEDKVYSFVELTHAFNVTESETIELIKQLEELQLIFISTYGQDYYKDSLWRFRAYQNLDLEFDKEYLVLQISDKSIVTFTHSPSGPVFYPRNLFTITDPDETGWVTRPDGKSRCPEDLNYPYLWDRYSDRKPEAVEIYHNYLKKIGLLQSDAKELIDPKHEKAREERITKQIEKRQLRDQNKSKYHFLAWLESKSILPEQSTDEQIMEAVMQTLKEIKQRS